MRERVLCLLAEYGVELVRKTYCHSIEDVKEGNPDGRVERYLSMLWRASIADPMMS